MIRAPRELHIMFECPHCKVKKSYCKSDTRKYRSYGYLTCKNCGIEFFKDKILQKENDCD